MKPLFILLVTLLSQIGFSQNTESPYLEVLTPDAVIPLQHTNATVEISGSIAHVQISQTYQNTGNTPIEAKYVFPLSTQAAVHKMTMTIGNRTIAAQIFEKQEAQNVYDKAIKAGKRAAKLDQHRPNVFKMNVGNIMENDVVRIDIYYTEMLVPTLGNYQFVFPGVVGPRFTGESTTDSSALNQPYTKKGIADTFNFDLNVQINAGMTIADVSSNTHDIKVHYPNTQIAEVSLSEENTNPSNRDFILTYNMRGKAIQTGMLLYEDKDEKFFAFMMEPPKATAKVKSTAREYVFIVDVSGSMNGYPLDVSKKLLRNLLVNLKETDRFNILLFAASSSVLSSTPLVCSEENIQKGLNFLSSAQGGGGTELLNALQTAYSLPRTNPTSARSMVVITDGYVSVEREAFELIEKHLDQANVFTFGIGSSVNRYLIEGMAKVSQSESFIATNLSTANTIADHFRTYIATPVLNQIKIKTEGFQAYDITPSSVPDVFASRPILIFGKYKGNASGKLTITGNQGDGIFKNEFNIANATLSKSNKALKYLWARKKIERLDDYKSLFYVDTKSEVIQLGLTYNLLTRYTSFVAVDTEIVNKDGTLKRVKQPLPMPENVNNSAVGAEASVKGKTRIGKHALAKSKAKIGLKSNYKILIEKLLETYDGLRIHVKKDGTILKVETLVYGEWIENKDVLKRFKSKAILKPLQLSKDMVVVFRAYN